jgi:hypothetical protein
LLSLFAAANFEGSTTGTNQYPLPVNTLYTGTKEMFRKGFQSLAASKRQTGIDMADLAHPDQHRYMVFKDEAYERKDHFLELYSDHVGFCQVSLVKTLTKVSKILENHGFYVLDGW